VSDANARYAKKHPETIEGDLCAGMAYEEYEPAGEKLAKVTRSNRRRN